MTEDDFISREERRMREKQAVCNHPSFKCSICGKYKDNIVNDYKSEIELLRLVLGEYERLLVINNIDFISYKYVITNDIIKEYTQDKYRKIVGQISTNAEPYSTTR